jgi:hypothetical protein
MIMQVVLKGDLKVWIGKDDLPEAVICKLISEG